METIKITVGADTAELTPSGWNINLNLVRDGKRLFGALGVLMSNGAVSREPNAAEAKIIRGKGIDPATRRIMTSNPPCGMLAELALLVDAASLKVKADADAKLAAHKAAVDGIEGLKELRAALNEQERYSSQFSAMMEDEQNDGVRPPRKPRGNVKALTAQYPRAAAYMLAESWACASHDVKASAGTKAEARILAGENHTTVIADMKAAWSAHCDQHVWD